MIFETIYVKTSSQQHVVADNNIQRFTQASEEAYILDKDKTNSSSPSTTGSRADMALVPPSPSLSAENVSNDNDCKLTTLVRIQNLQCPAV